MIQRYMNTMTGMINTETGLALNPFHPSNSRETYVRASDVDAELAKREARIAELEKERVRSRRLGPKR